MQRHDSRWCHSCCNCAGGCRLQGDLRDVVFHAPEVREELEYVLLCPTTILAIGLPLALLPDIGVHYYEPDVPQNSIMMRQAAAAEVCVTETGHTEDAHGGGHH